MHNMKIKLITYIFLLIFLSSCAEKSACEKFKKGDFYEIVLGNENINKKVTRIDNSEISLLVKRNGKTVESTKDYKIIEWINECDYILKIDESKMEMDESMREINRNGGILCEFEFESDNYLHYKCTNYESSWNQKIRTE